MQREIQGRIECHLDNQLGFWSRLMPWRRELVTHLEEAYENNCQQPMEKGVDETSWQAALDNLGDLKIVSQQLREQHWPQHLFWRIVVVAFSVATICSFVPLRVFLKWPAMLCVSIPLGSVVAYDLYRGSVRWQLVSRFGTWGCLCGVFLGSVGILTDFSNPANIGWCMALSICSAFYGVLLFSPSIPCLFLLLVLVLLNNGLMFMAMHSFAGVTIPWESYWPSIWDVERFFLLRSLAVCVAGLCLGIARFGFARVSQHAYSLGTGVFLVCSVVILGDMSDPTKVVSQILLAIGAMLLTSIASLRIHDCLRIAQRA